MGFSRINLAIVGAQKCGTTALAYFISQHPDIFVVNGKEGHVFDRPDIQSLSQNDLDSCYQNIMNGYTQEPWVCDATPIYAYWQDIPRRIVEYNPDIKVIFMVRDPVDRAVSHYHMEKHRGHESAGILRAFMAEKKRLANDAGNTEWDSSLRHHSYLDRGVFSEQIKNLKTHIPEENLLLLSHQHLLTSHQSALNTVFQFLNVEPVEVPPEQVFQGSYSSNGFQLRLARYYASWILRGEKKRLQDLCDTGTYLID